MIKVFTNAMAMFSTEGLTRYAMHPMYLSPTYDQLEYSPYYVHPLTCSTTKH